MKSNAPKPSKPPSPRGRPVTRQIKINATPEQVAQAIFKAGRKPDKPRA